MPHLLASAAVAAT